ncbi:MAG: ACT domain-containing protein [Firmicutes bacterium]|nr:ACT domain-containing protein [Bacillota bacterium]
MRQEKDFFIVDKKVLPEIFIKVMEVKKLLESRKEKTVQDAVNRVGISRSAFYKYRDSVFPLYENTIGKTVTIAIVTEDTQGLLSAILNDIADIGGNILTINQSVPVNSIANVTITIETNNMSDGLDVLMAKLESHDKVRDLRIIARE